MPATTPPDDYQFLVELIRLIDADPAAGVDGRAVAGSLGCPDAEVEPVIRRLKNRGLIDWAPGPRRLGDGWSTTPLAVTPDGYRFDDAGFNR